MKTIKVYSPSELKAKYPDGFKRAHRDYIQDQCDIPWQDEIMNSLKAIYEHSGINLRDWQISGDYPDSSWVRLSFPIDAARDLYGQRALAWIENNLFSGLREHRTFMNRVKKYDKWFDFTKYGQIPDCPFTGYCADDDFIESLLDAIKNGHDLGSAYANLAKVAGRLFEQEIEYMQSEEHFLEQDDLTYTKDGYYVSA